jgi:hypothetical protein
VTQENQSPAFPFTEMHTHGSPFTQWKGMTMRDYFAAKAMESMCELYSFGESDPIDYASEIAKNCYQIADAMLKARES